MQAVFALFLQFALFSLTIAEETVHTTDNAWKYGSGGGVIGFIVLILDIIVALEVLKSSRPVSHKVLWLLVVFLFPILGIILYYLFSNRSAHNGSGGYESIA
ncbi:hypothetical protein BJ878DRAFT_533972 [Calycina marina]|uniref:Cardiolipin synthase N-terminal domain-containing protein n=1 Tax=Calycina marina TaxID=1763456 RepID=A0A9P7Z4S9_9HELO|nr:hypothetical protein BJ878DRAFT_533972 [Calycina marina]